MEQRFGSQDFKLITGDLEKDSSLFILSTHNAQERCFRPSIDFTVTYILNINDSNFCNRFDLLNQFRLFRSSPVVIVRIFVGWLGLAVGWLNLLLVVAIVAWVIVSAIVLNNGWGSICHGWHIDSNNAAVNLSLACDALTVNTRLKKNHGSS